MTAPTEHVAPAGGGQGNGPGYPLRIEGHISEPLSPWLWLVKWILVIPHLMILAFLWLAFAVLTVIAGFSILFSGVYPRSIFVFNVGVLRWTWRVAFYTTSAFATDRYPPFCLESVPTYPADLDVDYPERLSRGLVLVKWWLLAIPQYLVVAVLSGGVALIGWPAWAHDWPATFGGLIGILSIVAIIINAVKGHYPERLFATIMGLNRWVWRVIVYAALMRDEYPPFRLDEGAFDRAGPTIRDA